MNTTTFFIFAIFDQLTQAYGQPFCYPSIAEAKRAFSTMIKSDPQLYFNRNDYSLYIVGDFDREKGIILARHEHLQYASDIHLEVPEVPLTTD